MLHHRTVSASTANILRSLSWVLDYKGYQRLRQYRNKKRMGWPKDFWTQITKRRVVLIGLDGSTSAILPAVLDYQGYQCPYHPRNQKQRVVLDGLDGLDGSASATLTLTFTSPRPRPSYSAHPSVHTCPPPRGHSAYAGVPQLSQEVTGQNFKVLSQRIM